MNSNEKSAKVYITKYALTKGKGIIEVDDAEPRGFDGVFVPSLGETGEYVGKIDWYKTREDAVTRAYGMKRQRLASLKRKIERIEKLEFE